MSYWLIFLLAFLFTFLLILLALRVFPRLGLMDRPKKYGLSRAPIPYSGGILIFLVFVGMLMFFFDFDKHFWGLLLAASLIAIVSFFDDRFNLNPWLRLGVQLFSAVILIISGIGIDSIRNPLGGLIALDSYKIPFELNGIIYHFTILADLFTIFWVLGMMNTVNWVDGVNGMASGICMIGFMVLFFLSVRPEMHYIDQTAVATMSIILAACCLAFVIFEFYPAKILMGDSGTMFLGLMLATLAIFSGGKVATAFLVMGVPILDAVWVVSRRILQGKNPLKGDLQHFYHRMIAAGLSEKSALLIMYTFSALFGAVALLLDDAYSKGIAVIFLVLVMAGAGVLVVRKGKR